MIGGDEEQLYHEILHSKILNIMILLKILQSSYGFSLLFPMSTSHIHTSRSFLN